MFVQERIKIEEKSFLKRFFFFFTREKSFLGKRKIGRKNILRWGSKVFWREIGEFFLDSVLEGGNVWRVKIARIFFGENFFVCFFFFWREKIWEIFYFIFLDTFFWREKNLEREKCFLGTKKMQYRNKMRKEKVFWEKKIPRSSFWGRISGLLHILNLFDNMFVSLKPSNWKSYKSQESELHQLNLLSLHG